MKKSLIALAFGTLGLGIAEFTMMGILPYVARDLNISIPVAGHFISAYALGVCAGAPMLIVARKRPLKHILLVLMALMLVGNLGAAMAPDYWLLLAARFISGLPHGAYFGVASIVAGKLADEGKSSEAVSIMIAGMTVANLFGIPLGTAIAHAFSWRAMFALVAAWDLYTFYMVWRMVPEVPPLPDHGLKSQFAFLGRPAPWFLLGAIMLGNGGVFCWYSYINPLLVHVYGFAPSSMTYLMVVAGADRIITLDIHADQIQGFFNIPVDHLLGVPILANHYADKFKNTPHDEIVVVSPDLGSVTRARKFAERVDASLAIIDKRRPTANVSEVMNIIGDVRDKTCILVDDMVDTAGTLCNGANALVTKGGARQVFACATHGVLSGPALDRIEESVLKEVVFLDTIPQRHNTASGKLKELSVASVFAEAINRIYSISHHQTFFLSY